MNKEYLIYDELKNMIPDYCFGKLTTEQNKFFETNISNYPELMAEANKIKSSFAMVDKNYIDNIIDEKTRNLSVQVNERIAQKNRFGGLNYLKYLVPTIAAALLFIFIFKPFSPEVIESSPVVGEITAAEVESMLDSVTNEADLLLAGEKSANYMDLSDLRGISEFYDEIGDVYDEFALEDFFGSFDDAEVSNGQITLSESNLYIIIENLNENDVKQILEEMNDVEILSQI